MDRRAEIKRALETEGGTMKRQRLLKELWRLRQLETDECNHSEQRHASVVTQPAQVAVANTVAAIATCSEGEAN